MASDPGRSRGPGIDSDGLATAFNGPIDEATKPYVREVPPEGLDDDEVDGDVAIDGTEPGHDRPQWRP